MTFKWISAVVVCLGLLTIGGKANAQSPYSGPPAQVCQDTDNLANFYGQPLSFDACVVFVDYLEKYGHDVQFANQFAVAECKYELSLNGGYQPGINTFGQCVSFYEALLLAENTSALRKPIAPQTPAATLAVNAGANLPKLEVRRT